ncbi:MAG: ExeM/NucH family extracellular endonuclease, partial [Herminiimonas sp.]|nr:ExeM/NucH family extracellular endonuclease [Herminiimonas sp.]
GQTGQCPVSVTVQTTAGPVRTIPQIQGSGPASPFVGTSQTTEGVVTHRVSNGFYLQDPVGDGDPATSDGIFVFTSSVLAVAVGDRVRLTATVAEFVAGDAGRTVTQLTGVSGLVVLSSGNVVTPVAITLPLADPRDFERFEGMLVKFTSPLTVSQNYFQGRYGQLTLSSGRLEKPTNRYPARSAQAIAAAAANAANVIVLDDNTASQNPNPIPYIGVGNTLRVGDTVSGLTGVIDFGLVTASSAGPAGYKLQPSVVPVFSRDNARTAAPTIPTGNVKISSFNVLNFFTTFTDGTTATGQTGQGCSLGASVARSNCRGADNLNEFLRQRAKIVAALSAIDADVFGLMEIQNNDDIAVTQLVTALNASVGAGTYAVVPKPSGIGATGDDAIRVAMIYKPARVGLVGIARSDTDPVNNRPPMAQTFAAASGERFSLIVNHLKSKGSCPATGDGDVDQGDGQGCWNATRVRQAQRLTNYFIPQMQAAAGDADVLVIGDFNAYGAEDPINALTATGLVNQIERFVRRSGVPYSYVFDGESGYLDHALATASLSAQVIGTTEWHINADEPVVIDYNTEFKPQDLYTASPYRASDHDPVVISLNLQSTLVDVTSRVTLASSGAVFNRATQTFNTTLWITNAGASALAGPLQVEITGLASGITVANATGSRSGVPYLTLDIGALAPGQKIAVPVNFTNPSRADLRYTARIQSGKF